MHRWAGCRHQDVDLLRALHHRAHVVVINEAYAFLERAVGDRGHARAKFRPLRRCKYRALAERLAAVAVDRVRSFGEHQHVAAECRRARSSRVPTSGLTTKASTNVRPSCEVSRKN